jgi:hypothetical protein
MTSGTIDRVLKDAFPDWNFGVGSRAGEPIGGKVRVRAKLDLMIPDEEGHWRPVLKGREVNVSQERAEEMVEEGYAEVVETEKGMPPIKLRGWGSWGELNRPTRPWLLPPNAE